MTVDQTSSIVEIRESTLRQNAKDAARKIRRLRANPTGDQAEDWSIILSAIKSEREAERRATITACLDVVNAEKAESQEGVDARDGDSLNGWYEGQVEVLTRIATRLKQLEEQK